MKEFNSIYYIDFYRYSYFMKGYFIKDLLRVDVKKLKFGIYVLCRVILLLVD